MEGNNVGFWKGKVRNFEESFDFQEVIWKDIWMFIVLGYCGIFMFGLWDREMILIMNYLFFVFLFLVKCYKDCVMQLVFFLCIFFQSYLYMGEMKVFLYVFDIYFVNLDFVFFVRIFF